MVNRTSYYSGPLLSLKPHLSMLFSPSLLCPPTSPSLALPAASQGPLAAPPSSPCCPLTSIVPSCLHTLPVSFACQSPIHLSRDSSKIASSVKPFLTHTPVSPARERHHPSCVQPSLCPVRELAPCLGLGTRGEQGCCLIFLVILSENPVHGRCSTGTHRVQKRTRERMTTATCMWNKKKLCHQGI